MMLPTWVSHWPLSKVYPSGAERATRPTPMLPPAPPTFSITIGCPSDARMRSAMMRAAASVDPPGGNGTTSVSARDGQVCACAPAMPAKSASARATEHFFMTSPSLSVNFGGALQRLFELFQRKILAARDLENGSLAARTELAGIRHLGGDIVRDYDGTVTIGVNEIVGAHGHAGNANFSTKIFGMHPCMRRTYRARKGLESRRPLRDVAD